MPLPPLRVTFGWVADGIARVAFAGTAGSGSEGNHHGEQIRTFLREFVAEHKPDGVIIDLIELDYTLGNWIGCFLYVLSSGIPQGRVCLVATGKTEACMRGL